jgi:hypothetical protein
MPLRVDTSSAHKEQNESACPPDNRPHANIPRGRRWNAGPLRHMSGTSGAWLISRRHWYSHGNHRSPDSHDSLAARARAQEPEHAPRPPLPSCHAWRRHAAAHLGTPAADPPQPQQGDFIVEDFLFHTGEVLPELRLHYMTLGAPTGEPVLVYYDSDVVRYP